MDGVLLSVIASSTKFVFNITQPMLTPQTCMVVQFACMMRDQEMAQRSQDVFSLSAIQRTMLCLEVIIKAVLCGFRLLDGFCCVAIAGRDATAQMVDSCTLTDPTMLLSISAHRMLAHAQ
jgi:hypothetical protein